MAKTVTIIPAFKNQYVNVFEAQKKKRVAGYARVSTDQEEQLTSYEAQVDYYSRYIKNKEEWEYVDVYTDEGISATNTKKREGFNKMIDDALLGKIDLIVTKSVSRFARNTVDSLTTVRKLKEKGIEVYFEKENIYTLDSKGELLLTIMSSLAQEESRSISENVTWGKRKKMADGHVEIRYKLILGYEKGVDGKPKIVESEAKVVRLIFSLFLEGKSYSEIAKLLTKEKILTPGGKENWNHSKVKRILQNEKYVGNATLQKTFTVDFLSKKQKKNKGEVPQYLVEGSHPAIVSTETFDLVQNEINLRKNNSQAYCTSIFSSKLICGECGKTFGRKVWHSTDEYRKVIWRCNAKYIKLESNGDIKISKQFYSGGKKCNLPGDIVGKKYNSLEDIKNSKQSYSGGKKCNSPNVTEEQIKLAFIMAVNRLIQEKEKYISDFEKRLSTITDTESIEKEIEELKTEIDVIDGLIRKCISDNATNAQDQAVFKEKYNNLVNRLNSAQEQLKAFQNEKLERNAKRTKILRFLETVRKSDIIEEFSEALWIAIVEFIKIKSTTKFTVIFRSGIEIEVDIAI